MHPRKAVSSNMIVQFLPKAGRCACCMLHVGIGTVSPLRSSASIGCLAVEPVLAASAHKGVITQANALIKAVAGRFMKLTACRSYLSLYQYLCVVYILRSQSSHIDNGVSCAFCAWCITWAYQRRAWKKTLEIYRIQRLLNVDGFGRWFFCGTKIW